jgi:hypothetical protein
MKRQRFLNMSYHSLIFICTLFLLVRAVSAQGPSPAGGGWYSFDGTDGGFLQTPDSDFLDTQVQEELTVELWVYLNRLPELGEAWILLQKQGSYEVRLGKTKTQSGVFFQLGFWAGDKPLVMDTLLLTANRWLHIAANFRKTEPPQFDSLFINGVWLFRGGFETREWEFTPTDSLLVIGRRFDGAIDEARISNTIRYQDRFTPPDGRLEPDEQTMALWHFDGAGDAILEDASGNGNRLAVVPREQLAWRTRTSMPTPRTEMSAIALGKKIYVVGGFDSAERFTTTEIYDTETDSWSIGAPMPEHVNHAGIGVVNGKI